MRDVSHLEVERNLFRYRPVDVAIRAAGDAAWHEVLRVVIAGVRAGSTVTFSAPVGLPAGVRRALGELNLPVSVETEEEWTDRLQPDAAGRPARVRLIGTPTSVAEMHRALADVTNGDPDIAVYDNPVTTAGRIELLPFLHEQALAITAHRFGNPDPTFADII